MPNKLTDAEVKKALECCDGSFDRCGECPLDNANQNKLRCWELEKSALDLINRQEEEKQNLEIELQAMRGAANSYKAEVERLKAIIDSFTNIGKLYSEIKAEAYKECLGKVEQMDVSESDFYIMVKKENFDNLLNELVGDGDE